MSITYSECVPAALDIRMQSACAILFCHLWPVQLYCIIPHDLIKERIFREVIEHKTCFMIFSTKFFLKMFSFYE